MQLSSQTHEVRSRCLDFESEIFCQSFQTCFFTGCLATSQNAEFGCSDVVSLFQTFLQVAAQPPFVVLTGT